MAPGRCSLICEPKLVLNRTQTSISWREERQARVIHAGWQISSWRSQSFMVVWYWLSAKAAGFNMFQLYYITIYSHTHAHTHMEYIYICNYYTVYNICMIKHTHIHAIRIYRYTHTHTHIYIYIRIYIYIYYIHNYCMSYVYLWYAENYLRYTLSSDSFSPGDFYQNGVWKWIIPQYRSNGFS